MCSATILKALISSQESISSSTMYFGFKSFAWSNSIFLFSPPLNHTFKSLDRKFSSISNSCKNFATNLLNIKGESAFVSGDAIFK
jgi:hypothetical protein